ncbi:MAG: SPASM domain-containing protein, partial [Firmicutes bacterium]|nr:SPASM domain-containing protein [Bacillota bacterium]
MVEYFYNIGVKNVIFSPCYNYGRTTDSRIVPNPANYVQNYMEAIQFAYKHGMRLSSNSFRYPGKHYCGALAGFNIALTTDNYISTCYEVVDKKSDPTGNFIVGEMNNGEINFYLNKIENLKAVEEEDYNKKCRACSYHLLCRGGCPVKLARNSVDSLNNLCAITKSLAPKMLEFLREHPDAVHTVFKNVSLSNINIE